MKIHFTSALNGQKQMIKGVALLICAALFSFANTAEAQFTYSEDFESMTLTDPNALGSAGWLAFGNIYTPGGAFISDYFLPAPNGGPGFSALDNVHPTPSGGQQYLRVYSDYGNSNHGMGNFVEANVYQEIVINPAMLGKSYIFSFDHRTAPVNGADPNNPNFREAVAFVKVVDIFSGFTLVLFDKFDTSKDAVWSSGTLAGKIDPSWNGMFLQFGFLSYATNNAPTEVLYDNVSFRVLSGDIPTVSEWGLIFLFLGLLNAAGIAVGIRSRRKVIA